MEKLKKLAAYLSAQQVPLYAANASFFLRSSTRRMASNMLRRNQIHLLGSDCHNLVDRPPNLGYAMEAIRKSLGEEALQEIQKYQQAVLVVKE